MNGKIIVKIESLHTKFKTNKEAEEHYMNNPSLSDSGDYEEIIYLDDNQYSKLLDFISNITKE